MRATPASARQENERRFYDDYERRLAAEIVAMLPEPRRGQARAGDRRRHPEPDRDAAAERTAAARVGPLPKPLTTGVMCDEKTVAR